MKKLIVFPLVFFAAVLLLSADPTVDGKILKGEYAHSISLASGKITLYYQADGKGGLSLAVVSKDSGWAGVGLGSNRMNGAYIYMGYVAGQKGVFSEQIGKGHRHSVSDQPTADVSSVKKVDGQTVLEFHIPVAKLPFKGKDVPFIVAASDASDLQTFHSDYDTGSFKLP